MSKIKVNKLPILIPVVAAVSILLVWLIPQFHFSSKTEQQLSLGERYLEEMDYNSAIVTFSELIAVDPSQTQAKLGLVQAYLGMEDYQKAEVLLEGMSDEDPSAEMLDLMVQTSIGEGKQDIALNQISQLIEKTDAQEWYDKRQELLQSYYEEPHSFFASSDTSIFLQGDQFLVMGNDTLDRFGDLGSFSQQASRGVLSAGYIPNLEAVPKKVYIVGRTFCVIDSENQLWTAGENRWGQRGLGWCDLTGGMGWEKMPGGENVVSVAGTTGLMFVLKNDGSLWYSGEGSAEGMKQDYSLPALRSLSSDGYWVVALTVDGDLFYRQRSQQSDGTSLGTWLKAGSNVIQFSVNGDYLLWMDQSGMMNSLTGSFPSFPEEWQWVGNKIKPDSEIIRFASIGDILLYFTEDQTLYVCVDGESAILEENCEVSALYSCGAEGIPALVVEYSNGDLMIFSDETLMFYQYSGGELTGAKELPVSLS